MFKRFRVWTFLLVLSLGLALAQSHAGSHPRHPTPPSHPAPPSPPPSHPSPPPEPPTHPTPPGGGHHPQPPGEGGQPETPAPGEESPEYDEEFTYYGLVQTNDPTIRVGRWVLSGDHVLLEFLAPGMRVEVEGEVKGQRIYVEELHVLKPNPWAYYEGPRPGMGWVRIWFAEGKVWRTQVIAPKKRVRLLACYQGSWQALPPELVPPVHPPRPGLWLLEGFPQNGMIRWVRLRRVAECEERS